MGYSPEEIEQRRKEEKLAWMRKGLQAAKESNVNKQIEDALIGGSTKLRVTDVLPEDLKSKMISGKESAKIHIEWFVTGLVNDFLTDWDITFSLIAYGTKSASVSVEFTPKKKKKETSNLFDIPIPDISGTIDPIMSAFTSSMDNFGKQMDQWSLDIDEMVEELSHDINRQFDPDIQEKWRKRGINLKDVVINTTVNSTGEKTKRSKPRHQPKQSEPEPQSRPSQPRRE